MSRKTTIEEYLKQTHHENQLLRFRKLSGKMSSRQKSCEVPLQDYSRIQLMYLSNGKLFTDYSFPPDKSSLTYVYSGDDRYDKMIFKRPKVSLGLSSLPVSWTVWTCQTAVPTVKTCVKENIVSGQVKDGNGSLGFKIPTAFCDSCKIALALLRIFNINLAKCAGGSKT